MELFPERTPLALTTAGASTPTRLQLPGRPWVDVVRACNHWVVETDWWRPPATNRAYYRLLIGRGGDELVEVYEDRTLGGWYLSRRYD